MLNAIDLRSRANLELIPNDKPGYYKWWADRDALNVLLAKLDVDFGKVAPYLEAKDDLFCIYVGIAVKESIRSRLNWHINDRHSESQVRNGTLSTLRQSISSLLAQNQYEKTVTNDFIDQLKVEYFENSNEIKSLEASEQIHRIERNLLTQHLYILNIQENNHLMASEIKKKLKRIRKESKQIGLI